MATTLQNRPWVLKKKDVVVYAPDFKVHCHCDLRITHHENAKRGSISLSIKTYLANSSDIAQVLTLNIPPEIVEHCGFAQNSDEKICGSGLLPEISKAFIKARDISTLTLKLGRNSIVRCPSGMESLSPAMSEDSKFLSFAKICQAKFLRLYFIKGQFKGDELDGLAKFSRVVKRNLKATYFNYARAGVVRKDWHVFSLPLDPPAYSQVKDMNQDDPPQYCEELVSDQEVGKRCGDKRSIDERLMSPKRQKRLVLQSSPPICSPTEANTSSPVLQSPSIRPTCFTPGGHEECCKLERLEHELRGLSDFQFREVLTRSGRLHLLPIPQDIGRDLQSGLEKTSFAAGEMIEPFCLKKYINEIIDSRLKSDIIDKIVDRAMSECRDEILDESKTHEAEFHEVVDNAKADVLLTAQDNFKDMEEEARKHREKMADLAEHCMNDIQNQGIQIENSVKKILGEMARSLMPFTQSFLQSTSSPGREQE
ncbi:hypothetical protein BJX61DRAFT_37468 [Aspergillus egyptiacus]|nr:hypothetical protein BJX61DRAFT_37468 [Aspergillus egyptiacus]